MAEKKKSDNTKNSKSGSSRKSSGGSKSGSKGASGKSKQSGSKQNAQTADKETRVKEMQDQRHADKKVIDEIWGIVIIAIGLFLIFCTQVKTMGVFGDAVHDVLKGLFGIMAYVLPYYFIVCALCLFFQKMQHINGRTVFFSLLVFINLCILNAYRAIDSNNIAFGLRDMVNYYTESVNGEHYGAIGMELGMIITKLIGGPGLLILCIALIIISILLVVNTPISKGIQAARDRREARRLVKEMEQQEAEAAAVNKGNVAPIPAEIAAPVVITPRIDDGKYKGDTSIQRSIVGGAKQTEAKDSSKSAGAVKADDERISKFVDVLNDPEVGASADDSNRNTGLGLDGKPEKAHDGYGLNNQKPGSGSSSRVRRQQGSQDGKAVSADRTERSERTIKSDRPKAVQEAEKKIQDKQKAKPSKEDEQAIAAAAEAAMPIKDPDYDLPPYNLLKLPKGSKSMMSDSELEARADLLETTLSNFNVEAKVVQVIQGSSVTRFEVKPAQGVKVSKIKNLADDLALNMRAKSIRIEAPIPGKAAVGIEIENEKSNAVLIRELVESEDFREVKSKISFCVGKDISGNNVIADLKAMPHLLIAGATGSGKSVCINTIITSILYKATPSEVRFVMIDPKVVELGSYNDIPHMLIPVVTDPKKAAAALSWSVNEMNQRYNLFAEEGVKDLGSFNEYMIANQEPDRVLPEIVIIIDELADLMMAASAQVQDSISRLTAKARAAGMHLIVATQRPSVDVVTGVIKANIPSRIAFSVSSQFDSRTILDMDGAEKLLGKGDMLFSPVGTTKPIRIQGPFISEEETKKVIEFVKKQGKHDFNEDMIKTIESTGDAAQGKKEEPGDELTDEVIAYILKQKSASTSMVQRRFRIGYNRASRIVDELEERGIIGPSDGAKPRQVLYTEEEYYSMVNGGADSAESPDTVPEEDEEQ